MKLKTKAVALAALMLFCLIASPALGVGVSAGGTFVDVEDGQWYSEAVRWCGERGFMNGTGEGYFNPGAVMTRAAFVRVMASMAGADLSAYGGSSFSDVQTGTWYAASVEWAYKNGLASGIGEGFFGVNGPLTREQAATFLGTFAKFMGFSTSETASLNYYNDALLISGWAMNRIKWAVEIGLLSGTGEYLLSPGAPCTRAQIALMIKKLYQYNTSDCAHVWSTPDCTAGRVCEKCGYTRGTPLGHVSGATCTSSGICTRCGKTVAAFGHLASPTCTSTAYCPRCKTTLPALGHYYPKPSDCTHSATCSRCGNVAPALGHNYPKPADCTNPAVCSRCGNVVPALGHTVKVGICARCGKEIFEYYTTKGYGMFYRGGAWFVRVKGYDILIANKSYALDKSYNPGGLTSETQAAFNHLVSAASKAGLNMILRSGFRSYSHQQSLYNNYVARDGKAQADRYSARPGHSEHQTGMAIDVNSLEQTFANSREGKWLAVHAHEYGFIIRYPKGKESVTGYMYEPWHIRYIGDLAPEIYASGLTLEEYLGVDSYYRY